MNDLVAAQSTGSGHDNELGLKLILRIVPLLDQRTFNDGIEGFLRHKLQESVSSSTSAAKLKRAILADLPPSDWPSQDTIKAVYGACVEEQNRSVALKALLHIIPRLSQKVLNGDLLRVLSVYQSDADPSIRLITLNVLKDTLHLLDPRTHKQVAGPAFTRSLRDGDASVRLFALQTLAELSLDPTEMACHVMPMVCTCLVDTEGACRAEAQRVMLRCVKELEGYKPASPEPNPSAPPPTPHQCHR